MAEVKVFKNLEEEPNVPLNDLHIIVLSSNQSGDWSFTSRNEADFTFILIAFQLTKHDMIGQALGNRS